VIAATRTLTLPPRGGNSPAMMSSMGRRRWWAIAIGAVCAIGAAGCDGKKDSGGAEIKPEGTGGPAAAPFTEWKVGAYLSLSGEDSAFGIDTREGIELAVEDINKKGGPKGKPIKVLYEDDKSKPDETTNKVLQLIDRDKVVALLGEVASSRSKAGGIVANKKKIPMITPSSTNPDVTKVGPFVFRVCFTDDVQGQMGAEFIINKLGKKKIAVLYASDDLYSSGLSSEFKAYAKKLGGEIVIEKSFLKKETNFTTYINEIKDAKPEIIYAPIYYNAMVPIARQAKAVGVKGDMFVGGDGWDAEELLKDAGDEMEGAYFTNHYAPDVPWENSKDFLAKYKAAHNHPPTSLAAMGYDAARLLADAMGRAKGYTPDDIREAIQSTKNFPGATGNITIDAERNADKSVVVVQIKGKQFTYFATVNDKSGAPAQAPGTAVPASSATPPAGASATATPVNK
jgi:branched-chain amino acid transport system substrate-binding protein